MELDEAIAKAIREQNAPLAGRCVDHLRFRMGLNYFEALARVQRVCPSVTEAAWDALLYEADEAETSR